MLKKKLVALGLAAVFALVPLCQGVSLADDKSDLEAQRASHEANMARMKQREAAARAKANAASSAMSSLNSQLSELNVEANALAEKTNKLQGAIDANQAKISEQQKEMSARLGIYKKRLRDIYINGQINYLDVLLGARDFSDFSTRMFLLQKIVKGDINMMEAIKKITDELNARQAVLDADMRDLKATKANLDAKRSRVQSLRDQRAAVFNAADAEARQSRDEYARELAASENVAAMLRTLEETGSLPTSNNGGGGTGRFVWPCSGEITSYYGWRTHPIFGTRKYHSGMDIAVDYGTPIRAADSGTVICAGWLGGYGYCVMIDHGGGLVSLYGHNQSLNCSEGQFVGKGAVIAYAGSTGYSTGPHCHFEVRLHGEVTEPLNYLP